MKKTLHSQESYFRSLIENTVDVITVLDSKGVIFFQSPSVQRALGYLPEEMIGKRCLDYIHPDDHALIIEHLRTGGLTPGAIQTSVYRSKHKDGSWRVFESTAKYLADNTGMQGVVVTSRDITDQKKIEKMKDEFIEMASHELRTPMSILKLAVGQVYRGACGVISARQKETLALALTGVDRLSRLVDDLLDLRKMEAGEMPLHLESIPMTDLLGEIRTMFEPRFRERGLELRITLQPEGIRLYADRDRLIQLFYNLIGNALKFTEKGWIQIGLRAEGNRVELDVSDTGNGIAPSDLGKMFGKFEQLDTRSVTGEKGTGLGLCISKKIVEMHGGSIQVESVLGKGTCFKVYFPVVKPSKA